MFWLRNKKIIFGCARLTKDQRIILHDFLLFADYFLKTDFHLKKTFMSTNQSVKQLTNKILGLITVQTVDKGY